MRETSHRIGLPCTLALTLLCAHVGCVEPRYVGSLPSEAGTSPDAHLTPLANDDDASTPADTRPADGGTPAWWTSLKSDYALRVRFFGHDRSLGAAVRFKHELLMLAKVSVDPSGTVQMETQRCRDDGFLESSIGVSDEFKWAFPERLSHEHFELAFEAGALKSEAAPRTIGYVDAAPSECTQGGELAPRADQPWLGSGSCTCGTDLLPSLPTDCRVTDADADGQPGITVLHNGSGAGPDSARVKDDCQIVEGKLAPDGRVQASYIENYDYLGLSCGGSVCAHNDILVCPLALNPVLFEPLPALSPQGVAWDCPSLLDAVAAGKFFPSDMLTFPADC